MSYDACVETSLDSTEVEAVEPNAVLAGRYRLLRPIGDGGNATVWEANDRVLARPVAVKVLRSGRLSEDAGQRYLREARVVAAIRHPNVVKILDIGMTQAGLPFLVMERLDGRSLSQTPSPMGILDAVTIATRVLSGLVAVHEAGVVHRDIKPENIFLEETAEGVTPKLIDFGISRAVTSNGELKSVLPTRDDLVVGTPQFMSPEQARGADVDARSDLWAVGVMMYEMLAGRLPFDADHPGDIIALVVRDEPVPAEKLRRDLPGPLAAVLRRALTKKREDRFQTAREMRAALVDAMGLVDVVDTARLTSRDPREVSGVISLDPSHDARGPGIDRPTLDAPALGRGRAKPILAGALALVVLVVVAVAVAWAIRGGSSTQAASVELGESSARPSIEASAPADSLVTHVVLEGLPADSEVRVDGVVTTLPIEVPSDGKERSIEVIAPGGRWSTTHSSTVDMSYRVDIASGVTAASVDDATSGTERGPRSTTTTMASTRPTSATSRSTSRSTSSPTHTPGASMTTPSRTAPNDDELLRSPGF